MTSMPMTAPAESRFWDRIASKYAKRPVKDVPAYERTLARTRAFLSPEDRVLEAGCGTGTTALKLSDAVAHITASDISGEMIAIAREKAVATGNVAFVQSTIAGHQARGERYDAVLAFNLLHLIEDLPGAVRGIAALLPPGGLFVSKTPCLGDRGWFLRLLVPAMQAIGKAPFVGFVTGDGMERAIAAAGFEIVETGDYPAGSRFIVGRKR